MKLCSKRNICITTAILILLGLCTIIPHVVDGYMMMLINVVLMWTIAAYSITITLGMCGQLSFCVAAFQGIGAYTAANLCTGRLGPQTTPAVSILMGVAAAAIVSMLLGLLLFRLRGVYFTFATIGVVQVATCFFLNNVALFGGANGIPNIPYLKLFGNTFKTYYDWFYLLAIVVLIMALFVSKLRNSPLGRAMAAVRDNETAAKTLGVNVYATKVTGFAIAGAVAGLAGALYALHGRFVSSDMFTFQTATDTIIMAMLGGINTTLGAFIGSLLVTILPEVFRALEKYLQLFWGIAVILLMIFMPDGFMGLIKYITKGKKATVKTEQTR